MNIFEAITKRRSVYKFKQDPIDDKLIGVMLHFATYAPSAGNMQEWNFIVVKDEEKKKKLAQAALDQKVVEQAPVVIVVCADLDKISLKYGKRGEIVYALQDTAAATMIMLLTARAIGLGSIWIGAFDEDRVKDILELPANFRPTAIVPIGYIQEEPEASKRFPFEDFTFVNRYGDKYDISFFTQPVPNVYKEIKPIGNIIQDALAKRKKREDKKKISFKEFLKKLTK